ncbi:hypothetical protein [Kitasatospora mediocidica]|uniref:hypothetical protein n=1 Tax=Kitasatospora mediocidica TaxID=58352 RepID=UPI0006920CB1|nr:hypothetical protein [Kitasatospora mediocidica]
MSRATVNRLLLGLVGLVLLVAALLVLAGGLNLYRDWHLGQPSWWPLASSHRVALSEAARARWRDRGWWWPVVIGVLALVAALALGWLLAQLRRSSPVELALPTPDRSGLTLRLRGSALVQVLEAGAAALPGVARARVRSAGRPPRLRIRAQLLLEAGTEVTATLDALEAGPLTQARALLGGPAELPLDLRLRVAAPPKRRVQAPRHPRRPRVV